MRKKIIAFIVTLLICIPMFACGSNEKDLYDTFIGEYKQSGDAPVSDGYLTIAKSPDELSLRFFGAEEWTETKDIVVQEDGTLKVSCEYYLTKAEPDDLLVFTLKQEEDDVLMTVVESEFPLLQVGDTILFTKY